MNKVCKQDDKFFISGSPSVLSSIQYIFSFKSYIEAKNLYINCNNIESLSKWSFHNEFDDYLIKNLIHDLVTQVDFLELNDKTIIGFNLDDVYVVDNKNFFICPNLSLLNIIDDTISIKFPFNKPLICCPEILTASSLPIVLHSNSIKFMIGQLCIFCYFKSNILRGNELMAESQIEDILNPIKFSGIYWFVKKSILPEGKNRQLLYVD